MRRVYLTIARIAQVDLRCRRTQKNLAWRRLEERRRRILSQLCGRLVDRATLTPLTIRRFARGGRLTTRIGGADASLAGRRDGDGDDLEFEIDVLRGAGLRLRGTTTMTAQATAHKKAITRKHEQRERHQCEADDDQQDRN